jgi:S1-C subfamily serine protease
MKIGWKKVLIVVLMSFFIFNTNSCYAKTERQLYIAPSKELSALSDLINKHISEKEYYIYKADTKKGVYYFQPKYMGTYFDGDYIVINLKQVNSDVYFYIQNNSGSRRMEQILEEYLQKHNFRGIKIKDQGLIDKFEKETSSLISYDTNLDSYFNSNNVTNTSNISPETAQNKVSQLIANKPTELPVKKVTQKTISPYREMSKAGQIFNEVNNGVVTVMSTGHGSGFLVDPTGLIITNYHVVKEHTDDIRVRFGQKEILPAKVVECDPENDVAVLWVNLKDIKNYTVLKIFNPPDNEPLVMIGEKVIAIGSPIKWETYEKTMTEGIVGKFDNKIIMHDASINHGNSGGPLINFGGYVVGINTFGLETTDNNGLGGSIAITKSIPLIGQAKAHIKALTPPSSAVLPDIPIIPYSYEIMKNAYYKPFPKTKEINKRTKPYIIKSHYYDIAIITPPQKYRAMANDEEKTLKRHKSRLQKAGETVSNDEYESKTQADWEYNKPVVTVVITPKPFMTGGSITKLLLMSAMSGLAGAGGNYYGTPAMSYSYAFKKDFDKLQMVNLKTSQACQSLASGREPITKEEIAYFNYGSFNLVDKSYVGLYEYDAKSFTNFDDLTFQIYSKDKQPPLIVKIPQQIKNNIREDFQPYWEYVNTKKVD